jgi:hypothetical protein
MQARHIDAALGALLALGFTLLAFAFRQPGYWSDGRALVEMTDAGQWNYHNLLYLPVAHLAAELLRLFGVGTRTALELLSAGATGLALALAYAAARGLGRGRAASVAGTLVLASAPTVWFYATCVEVHPLALASAAGVTLVLVRAAARGTLGASALPAALAFCVLQGTHVSAVLCVPALAFLAGAGRGRLALPRHVLPALLAVAGFAFLWYRMQGAHGPAQRFGGQAVRGLGTHADLGFFWHELVVEGGLLYPVAAVVLVRSVLREPALLRAPLPRALLLLLATFVPFALSFIIEERGAYYQWALPALALCAARLFELLGALGLPVAAVIAGVQLVGAREQVRAWSEEYPGHEWVPTLEREVAPDALVLTLFVDDWVAVRNHSRLDAFRPPDATLVDPHISAGVLVKAVGAARKQGRTVVILRNLYEIDFRAFAEAVQELVRRFGTPRPGSRAEYLILDAPAGAEPP